MKYNTASQKIGAQMVTATDGSAFTTASGVTTYVTVDAGIQALGSVASGVCTHEGNGYHTYAPSQVETSGSLIAFTFIGSGAVPATLQVYTSWPQTGDSYPQATGITGLIGTPANTTISADIASIATATNANDLTSKTADAGSVTTGTVISGTYTDTSSDNDVYWITAPVTPAVGGYGLRQTIRFDLPLNRIPTQLQLKGYWTGTGQVVNVFAYNTRTLVYDQLTNTGTNLASRTTELIYGIPIPRDYVDSSGGVNNIILLELRSTSTTTTFRLRIDRALIYHISEEAPFTMTAPTVNDIWTAPSRTLTDLGSDPVDLSVIAADVAEATRRLGFVLAREAGACSDPQTSTPSYSITISGVIYTVLVSGVTSAGNRSSSLLTTS